MDINQSVQQENPCKEEVQQQQQQQQQIKQIKKDKDQCLELKNKAGLSFSQSNFKEAADIYMEAIDYCPQEDLNILCILNSNIAICFMQQNDFEEAITYCSKALEFNPEFVKALINRAECYEKTEKLEEALEDYKKLKELQPKDCAIIKKYIDLDLQVQDFIEKRKQNALKRLQGFDYTVLQKMGLNLENMKMQKNEDGTFNIQFSK